MSGYVVSINGIITQDIVLCLAINMIVTYVYD
jgi:hypothetical protein